jgi:sensor histidine kinase YesM
MKNVGILNDKTIKLFGITILGLIIPNITGLITNHLYSFPELIACYAYFIFLSFAIWQGDVWLMYYMRRKFTWRYNKYYKVIGILCCASFVCSGALSALLLTVWKLLSKEMYTNWPPVFNSAVIIVFSAIFITSIYENIFLNNERMYNLLMVEQLNIVKGQAELEALKNQLDPHFIFNSLNTLSYLITKDPPSARLYNDALAKVYRYILSNKEKDLVLLKEEIEFISNYFYLIKIRFSDAVNMMIEITDLSAEDFLIPPISMQALVENAIKHNEFSDKAPLGINISVSSHYAVVKNEINPKSYAMPASGIGLSNLDNRYKLITKKNIVIENNSKIFSVKLPILKF